ncbi:UNVERIFIED_CONTAM: hypothetical protein FKN15_047233 [Acipenser sinensis]
MAIWISYQFNVLEAILAPIRGQGIWVLSYLDNWLICASSHQEVSQQSNLILTHLLDLGLKVPMIDATYLASVQ